MESLGAPDHRREGVSIRNLLRPSRHRQPGPRRRSRLGRIEGADHERSISVKPVSRCGESSPPARLRKDEGATCCDRFSSARGRTRRPGGAPLDETGFRTGRIRVTRRKSRITECWIISGDSAGVRDAELGGTMELHHFVPRDASRKACASRDQNPRCVDEPLSSRGIKPADRQARHPLPRTYCRAGPGDADAARITRIRGRPLVIATAATLLRKLEAEAGEPRFRPRDQV